MIDFTLMKVSYKEILFLRFYNGKEQYSTSQYPWSFKVFIRVISELEHGKKNVFFKVCSQNEQDSFYRHDSE